MTLLDQDIGWLVSESRNDPDQAQKIVEALVARAQQLQTQTDELHAENVLLKRGIAGANAEQVQQLKTDLRELRLLADKHGLNADTIAFLNFAGLGLHIHAPAPLDQTLTLELSEGETARDLRPIFISTTTRLDSLIAITSSFQFLRVNNLALPISEAIRWRDAQKVLRLGKNERVEAMQTFDDLDLPRHLLVVTRMGWVKILSWNVIENIVTTGQSITPQDKNDAPVWIGSADYGDVLLLTRNGRWGRFPLSTIEAVGSQGISLEQDDDVVCACVIGKDDATICFVGADGAVFCVTSEALVPHKKPGAKSQSLARNFVALSCFAAKKTDALALLTMGGELIVSSFRALPIAMRPSEARSLNIANRRLISVCKL
jgi:DNA gyrase/topoisomerase IV subunit A